MPDQDTSFKNVFKRNPGKIIIFEGLVEFCLPIYFMGNRIWLSYQLLPSLWMEALHVLDIFSVDKALIKKGNVMLLHFSLVTKVTKEVLVRVDPLWRKIGTKRRG